MIIRMKTFMVRSLIQISKRDFVPWRRPVDGFLHRLLHNDARYGGHDDPDEHESHPDILGRHHKRNYPHSEQRADLKF